MDIFTSIIKPCDVKNVEHFVIDYDKKAFCGHPRQGGIKYFGNGEIAILYWRAACNYETGCDISHSQFDGYQSRSSMVLRRSLDYGKTWLPENDIVVWNESKPVSERAKFLEQDSTKREILDMSDPRSMFFFGRTLIFRKSLRSGMNSKSLNEETKVFAIRSIDKGNNWESIPVLLDYPPGANIISILKDNHPPVTMPDGSLVGAVSAIENNTGSVWLYGSENNGMSWHCLSRIANDEAGIGRPTYANLILLPDGKLQCYMLMLAGQFHTLCLSESYDCFSWSKPRPIIRYGYGPWAGKWKSDMKPHNALYRSPWPILLKDGRIAVIYARREYPSGIAVIESTDDGKTWLDPAILRDDASGHDIGYPVAAQMEDGRIFTAYYYQLDDGNNFNGTRFIAGTFFELK